MADRNQKNPGNVPGPFYVDYSCTDCDMCRQIAPATFRRDDEAGVSIVYAQPQTEAERALAIEAIECCPTDSIGSDG